MRGQKKNEIRVESNEGDAKIAHYRHKLTRLKMMTMTKFVCITYIHGMQNVNEQAKNKSAI